MKVTLGTNQLPSQEVRDQDALIDYLGDPAFADQGVTDSDETPPTQSTENEVQKEVGPFSEIPDLCSRINTLIYDIEATPLYQDKDKILGKLIGAMELLQENLK